MQMDFSHASLTLVHPYALRYAPSPRHSPCLPLEQHSLASLCFPEALKTSGESSAGPDLFWVAVAL